MLMVNPKNDIKGLQKAIAKFRTEVMVNPKYDHLDIMVVTIDHKENIRRAVVIIEEQTDLQHVEQLVAKYFRGFLYKVISREGIPKGSTALQTGNGIRHKASDEWGTVGGFFNLSGEVYGLSNNHVIAQLNNAQKGDQIIYSGNIEAGILHNFIQLLPPPAFNSMDAALFKVTNGTRVSWHPVNPNQWIGPKIGTAVYKVGQATGLTYGAITGTGASAKVRLGDHVYQFQDVVMIKGTNGHFNSTGDSGSVVLTSAGHNMVALVFAKYYEYCFALPISKIQLLFS